MNGPQQSTLVTTIACTVFYRCLPCIGYITWKACARPSPTPAAEADLPDAGLHQQAILNFMLFFLGGCLKIIVHY